MDLEARFRVHPKGFRLADCDTSDDAGLDKAGAEGMRADDLARLTDLQERLYAEGRRSLLIVIQAMDAAGKDGTIAHVMTGVNPQGVQVTSFKQPSHLELAHDFLWRCSAALPADGAIGIFNRSHYEEVLVLRVHPEYLAAQGIDPQEGSHDRFWDERLRGDRLVGAPPRARRHADRQVLPERLEGRAAQALPGSARPSRTSTGSSAPATSPSAPTGTPTSTRTRRR